MEFLNCVIQESDVGIKTADKLARTGSRLAESSRQEGVDSPLSNLDITSIEKLVRRHAELGMSDASERVTECSEEAMNRTLDFESAERKLKMATAGMGISNKAEELKDLAKEMGSLQAETALLKGMISQQEANIRDVEKRIDEIRQREDSDSLLNRRISRFDDLMKLTDLVTQTVRKSFAEPLESSFREGFELLSRKSGRLQDISIDTNDYSTSLSMRGFEGNWLDRDLSATERQHVGLALVYALRRASTEWALPLPVIIDTPTSRMDSEHKSWSVTRFYPQLSQQVVVLATSDDLAGGLFEELDESGVLGAQILVREVSENSVEAITSDLGAFFGGA
jgi:DNA sulfur modification protein DndD